ncbi:hypothetical protein V493_05062 [Pseudogymnoascus sp. VKM F-4281 (FW-2241)]|nr:hypothetical protein V493_05062 [Pseudogymnoascus sp. VKM F-4281 (FW-2241)]
MLPNIEGGQCQDPANSVFNTALKQSTSLRTDLATLSSNPLSAPASLTGQISASLTSFSRTLDSYADLTKHELNTQKAEKAAERLTNFRHDLADYKSQFERVKKDREDATAQSNRSELLGRRPHHGGSSTPDNPYANAQINRNAQAHNPWAPSSVGGQQSMSMGSGETTREAHAMREQNFFGNTHSALDEYLARGQAVLGDLGQQKEMLKGTQKRLAKGEAGQMDLCGRGGDFLYVLLLGVEILEVIVPPECNVEEYA